MSLFRCTGAAPSETKQLRVLHITNWYPSAANARDALFIRDQVASLKHYAQSLTAHVQAKTDASRWRFRSGHHEDGTRHLIVETPWPQGRGVEILTGILLILMRIRLGRRRWHVTNVHIAYPLFRFPGLVRFLYGTQVVITEHWSAYSKGFNLPASSPARSRITKMFSERTPIAVVSKALANDIQVFTNSSRLNIHIVPNVVDPAIFHPPAKECAQDRRALLMVANWAPIKKPFLVLEAVKQLVPDWPELTLRVIGHGAQWDAMGVFVRKNEIENNVSLLGPQDKSEIADEMRRAAAFLHPTDYETFSVVCAEAVSCACPVIASNVGAIPEVVGDAAILVENTVEAWSAAIHSVLADSSRCFTTNAIDRFAPHKVGQAYLAFLQDAVGGQR